MRRWLLVGLVLCLLPMQAWAGIQPRDGFGNPVDWFFILKLPARGFALDSFKSICGYGCRYDDVYWSMFGQSSSQPWTQDKLKAPPKCDCGQFNWLIPGYTRPQGYGCGLNFNTDCQAGWGNASFRNNGGCYLYADSNNPQLRYYADIGFGPLGSRQSPLYHTLKQMDQAASRVYWNDQYQAVAAAAYEGKEAFAQNGCFGPLAHSKGAAAFDAQGGFVLNTSTPDFPDPSADGAGEDAFSPLGCQLDDNLMVGQHVFAIHLDPANMKKLAQAMAGFGGGSFCGPGSTSCQDRLKGKCAQQAGQDWSVALHGTQPAHTPKYQAAGSGYVSLSTVGGMEIRAIIKSPLDAFEPWSFVANALASDLTVSSWWQSPSLTPTVCAGDRYAQGSVNMCQYPGNVDAAGRLLYSVENVIAASLKSLGYDHAWFMLGGPSPINNHSKWAIATPKSGAAQEKWVVAGSMNRDGYPESAPASSPCSSGQGGRSGDFYAFQSPQLWQSLADLVLQVCGCNDQNSADTCRTCLLPPPGKSSNPDQVYCPSYVSYQAAPSSYWQGKGVLWRTGPQPR